MQSATIRTYISALRAVLAEDKIKLSEDGFLLSSLIRACKLKNVHVVAQFPIYKGLLRLLIKEVGQFHGECQQVYLETLYKAMFTVAYFGLLRAGEIVQGLHVILTRNVHVATNKKKILFILNSSKTHRKGNRPQLIKINSHPIENTHVQDKHTQGIEQICPFALLNNYIALRQHAQHDSEQFFVFSDNSPVKPEHLCKVLHLMLSRLNFNQKLYNLHSFRIGQCGDLFRLGVTVESIKKLGRWKSNAMFTYFHD